MGPASGLTAAMWPYDGEPIQPIASAEVTIDTVVARGPVLLWGWYGTTNAGATPDPAIFDGVNALGRRVVSWRMTGVESQPIILMRPILCRQGIFVDVDITGAQLPRSIVILFEPVREEMLGPRVEAPAAVETE